MKITVDGIKAKTVRAEPKEHLEPKATVARVTVELLTYFFIAVWLASLVPVEKYTDNLVNFIENAVGYDIKVEVTPKLQDSSDNVETFKPDEVIKVHVTGYNLVEGQTDETPCIGASGKDLCGEDGHFTVACPRKYPLGTVFEIDGFFYTCEDRLAKKYDDRIDINCKLDMECPSRVTGFKDVAVLK